MTCQLSPPEPWLVVMVTAAVEPVSNKSGVEGGLDIENEDATGLATPGLGVSYRVCGLLHGLRIIAIRTSFDGVQTSGGWRYLCVCVSIGAAKLYRGIM